MWRPTDCPRRITVVTFRASRVLGAHHGACDCGIQISNHLPVGDHCHATVRINWWASQTRPTEPNRRFSAPYHPLQLLSTLLSDVCLEAEVSPRGNKSAASALPRRFDASPRSCLGLIVIASASALYHLFCLASTRGIGTFKLCYDIIIYNFHPFILFIYVFHTFKTQLHRRF